jgi:hypothetical protein
MSKRQQIMDEVDKALKNIKKINGYQTDAGYNVFAWRDHELQMSELPAIVYYDRIINKRGDVINRQRWALRVDIYCYASNPADVRMLIADVLKAIGNADANKYGNNAITTELGDNEMEIEHKGQTAGEAIVSITIIYDTPLWEI